jgi:hypothetical protein
VPHRFGLALLVLLAAVARLPAQPAPAVVAVTVDPPAVTLRGPTATWSLLVHGQTADGQLLDLTRDAKFQSLTPNVAAVSPAGVVRGGADGAAVIEVQARGQKLAVKVQVSDVKQPRRFDFENDIEPLFSRFSCNSSGCHGNSGGQNGFKLSVFGFDPAGDHAALVKESRGRRVLATAPESSLLLLKASGGMAHGGGVRIGRDTPEYQTLRDWVAAGVPFNDPNAARVTLIRVEPAERQLEPKAAQQLRVVARYSDGREADVTAHAKFQSNNEGLAAVSATGLVSAGEVPGEAAVMASFQGAVGVFRAVLPRRERIASYPKLPENNFIDGHVYRKLQKLRVLPSELADDADYLRRVYLDVIGTLPTADEARRFLADQRPVRRAKLVDELLERPEYADYWALKWSDVLRVDRQALGHKRAYAYYRWIRDSLAANKPYDQFVREIVTAEGPLSENGPANFYKVVTKPGEAASSLAQVFLGVRIACAECHHHPFDRWSQTDYYGMQAFFAPVTLKKTPKDDILLVQGDPPTLHPRTGKNVYAHALDTKMPDASPPGDRRRVLAAWLSAPQNPWFARHLSNRLWAHFLGRGLVEPVDDVRATNPPSNPELLDALAEHFVQSKFDLKQMIRAITASRTYQLSSRPNETNAKDEQNFSRALFRRIDAEVLLDMVSQTTGVGERFHGVPPGARAIQLWDSKVPHYFLKVFGRPVRLSACECERNAEPGVAQVLHLLNAPEIHAKLGHEGGTVARLVRAHAQDEPLVDELYLTFFSRHPTAQERGVALKYLGANAGRRREAVEDLAWSLLNTLEFVFNH